MKQISDKIQRAGELRSMDHKLLARKVGDGSVGILIGYDYPKPLGWAKGTTSAIYWDSKEDAVADLKAVIDYFESEEDE